MLIKRGKAEGWLHLSAPAVTLWAESNGIDFINASPKVVPGRGIGLIADRDLKNDEAGPIKILKIAEDLVLSGDAVRKHAQFDKDFRQVLESLGDFGRVGILTSIHLFDEQLQMTRSEQLDGSCGMAALLWP